MTCPRSPPSCAQHHGPWGQNEPLHSCSFPVQSALLYSETLSPFAPLILSSLLLISGDNKKGAKLLQSPYPKLVPLPCPPWLWQGPFSSRQRGCSAPVMGLGGTLPSIWSFAPRARVADVLLPPLGHGNPATRLAHSRCSFLIRIGCLDLRHPGKFLAISFVGQAELGDRGSKSVIATEGKAAGEFVSE